MVVNQVIVKARRTGSSIALTCPYAEEGRSYIISRTNTGVIVYHPVMTLEEMRESSASHKNTTLGDYEE